MPSQSRGIGLTYLIHVEQALVLLDLSFANVEMCGKVYPDEKVVNDAVITYIETEDDNKHQKWQ